MFQKNQPLPTGSEMMISALRQGFSIDRRLKSPYLGLTSGSA